MDSGRPLSCPWDPSNPDVPFAACDKERPKLKAMEAQEARLSDLYLKAVEANDGKKSLSHKKAGGKLPGERRYSALRASAPPREDSPHPVP